MTGCSLSPINFNLYIKEAINEVKENSNTGARNKLKNIINNLIYGQHSYSSRKL